MTRKTVLLMLYVYVTIVVLTPVVVWAKTIYVSPNGRSKSCSSGSPCSLIDGLRKARSGDTVILKNGTYRDNLVTRSSNVKIKAASKGKATIRTRRSPMASIKHSKITISGITFDGQGKVRGIDFSQASRSISNVTIENCTVKNTKDAGITVKPRSSSRKVSNVTIRNNKVIGTGKRGVGEAVYVGNNSLKRRGGKYLIDTENIKIYGNTFTQFTDNCVDMKPTSRKVSFYKNTCEKQVKARRNRNHGTLVVRGFDNKAYNNKLNNVFGGQAIFNVAAKGGNKVYNNTVKKSVKTDLAIKTRERGFGSKRSEITNNKISGASSCRFSIKHGLVSRGNKCSR